MTEGAGDSSPRGESAKRFETRTKIIAGGALAGVAGLVGAATVVENVYLGPNRDREADHVGILEQMKTGEIEPTFENSVVVLRAGVNLRSTPHMTPEHWGMRNIAETVEEGTAVVIDRPIAHHDSEAGITWLGFTLSGLTEAARPQQNNENDTESNDQGEAAEIVSTEELADEMHWVNYTSLSQQQKEYDGDRYISVIERRDPDLLDIDQLMAVISADGSISFQDADDQDVPVAQAEIVSAGTADLLIQQLDN